MPKFIPSFVVKKVRYITYNHNNIEHITVNYYDLLYRLRYTLEGEAIYYGNNSGNITRIG